MLNSKSFAALIFAAMLATSAQSYAQTQPDPHHLAEGAGATAAAPGTEDQ